MTDDPKKFSILPRERTIANPERIFAGLEPDESEIKAKIKAREDEERQRKEQESKQRLEALKASFTREQKPYVLRTSGDFDSSIFAQSSQLISSPQSSSGTFVGTDDSGITHSIPDSARNKHVYISGKTQQGKSTLIRTMVSQDIDSGNGVCVIDAKGDLIPQLLGAIPSHRKNDCILLDLKTPVPLDFMDYRDGNERTVLVSDIIQIFKRLDEGWGVRMEALLRYVLHTLLVNGNCSFIDIYRILADRQFRELIVKGKKVQAVEPLRNFWNEQFDKLGKDASTPIIVSRMADFLLSPSLSTILDAHDATLNISDCMEQSKILLVNLQGATDEAMVFGSLLVSKIQQAAFRRASILKERRTPFYLYVDEFQNFRPSGFENILSMAGGLKLCLTLANQYFNQLGTDLQDAIINNVSTYFLFRMGIDNASRLKGELRDPVVPPESKFDVEGIRARLRWLNERNAYIDAMEDDYHGWSHSMVGNWTYRNGSAEKLKQF